MDQPLLVRRRCKGKHLPPAFSGDPGGYWNHQSSSGLMLLRSPAEGHRWASLSCTQTMPVNVFCFLTLHEGNQEPQTSICDFLCWGYQFSSVWYLRPELMLPPGRGRGSA